MAIFVGRRFARIEAQENDPLRAGQDCNVQRLPAGVRAGHQVFRIERQPGAMRGEILVAEDMNGGIFDHQPGRLNRAFLSRKRYEFRPVFVPEPPAGVCKIIDIGPGREPVGVVNRYRFDLTGRPRFGDGLALLFGETWAAADEDDGAAFPDSIDDGESVKRPSGTAGE